MHFFPRSVALSILLGVIPAYSASAQQRGGSGAIAGTVAGEDGRPVAEAAITVSGRGVTARTVTSDAVGRFDLPDVVAGLYQLTVRRIGFREAHLPFLRVIAGEIADVRVTLTASATQLSTVEIRVTPTSIDTRTTDLVRRIELAEVALVPIGRETSSLVDLVPGARRGFIWGGAGDAANNYQLDGVAVNHPGTGGDFIAPAIDWIEALEVRGIAAGAEHGGFQGGIVNAVTRTGTNRLRASLRSAFIAPQTTTSNLFPNEEGAEEVQRRELSATVDGPIIRDRLFYFVGGVVVDRQVEVPDVLSFDPDDTRATRQEFRDLRGIAKFTWRPAVTQRIDVLAAHTDGRVEHAGLNGIDDPAATQRVRAPTTFYELAWNRANVSSSLDARLAGFTATESRTGYGGPDVPGIQIFTPGRQPRFQNAIFNDRTKPQSIAGSVTWRREHALGSGSNEIVVGANVTRGTWTKDRTRNGGMTWMPYVDPVSLLVDPARAETWLDAASAWGGDIHIDASVEDAAIFVQDYMRVHPRFSLTPGLRLGRWRGWLTPAGAGGEKFLAASDHAIDPRLGLVWDVTGRSDFVVKGHFGRYHQGMSALFFDRAEGGNAYENERTYYQGPPITDSRTTFTPEERDANLDTFFGFSPTFVETILNEAGRVENYRQPFMDQALLSVEKRFGPRWKAEIAFTHRANRNIVGLVDRNLQSNYSPLVDVGVRDRVFSTPAYGVDGNPLKLPVVYVSNRALQDDARIRREGLFPRPPVTGYTYAEIDQLTFNPDIVLTTVGGARRTMSQLTASVRTRQRNFDWFGSVSYVDLRGNIAGLTGFGTSGGDFTAGAGVRPNERTNFEGRLSDFPAFEAKSWITAPLPYGVSGGLFGWFSLGEYFAPVFRISPRFRFLDQNGGPLSDVLFNGVFGQSILLEERGSRKYHTSMKVDLRLEKKFAGRGFNAVLAGDVFNALGSDAVVERNIIVNDATTRDQTSVFGAPRRRVAPLRLQLGFRLERQAVDTRSLQSVP